MFPLLQHNYPHVDLSKVVSKEPTPKNIYVSLDGDDSNPGTLEKPKRHLQAALNSYADVITGNNNIYMGEGIFEENIEARILAYTDTNGLLKVRGTIRDLTNVLAANSGTRTTIKVNSAGWSVNQYAGKYIRITAGSNYTPPVEGYEYLDDDNFGYIMSNTSDTLTLRRWSSNFNSTTRFKIVEPATTIKGITGEATVSASFVTQPTSIGFHGVNIDSSVPCYVALVLCSDSGTWLSACNLLNTSGGDIPRAVLATGKTQLVMDSCAASGVFSDAIITTLGYAEPTIRKCFFDGIDKTSTNACYKFQHFGQALVSASRSMNCSYGMFTDYSLATIGYYSEITNCDVALRSALRGFVEVNAATHLTITDTDVLNYVQNSGQIKTFSSLSNSSDYSADPQSAIIYKDTNLSLSGYKEQTHNTISSQLFASDSIQVVGKHIKVTGKVLSGSDEIPAPVVLSSTPSIQSSLDGTVIILIGVDDTNTVTLTDSDTLAGSGLNLSSSTMLLNKGASITLIYVSDDTAWYELSRSER